jgi:hypothetical protein
LPPPVRAHGKDERVRVKDFDAVETFMLRLRDLVGEER